VRFGTARRAVRLAPVPAAALLAAAAVAALLMDQVLPLALLTAALLLLSLQANTRLRPYLFGTGTAALGVFLVWPFLQSTGIDVIWEGPIVPVLGQLDVTREEIALASVSALRLAAVGFAFSAYALLLDHDRLVASASFARHSALAVALATRLVPTLERDAAGLAEAVRGRGVKVAGVRGHARLLSPLVAGSLERAANLAEAMEARGFGSGAPTRAPSPNWTFWRTAGWFTKRCPAVCGRAQGIINPGGRLDSAINFKTRWRWFTLVQFCSGSNCCAPRIISSAKATFSIGGTRRMSAGCGPIFRMTTCGFPMPRAVT